jgi:hypothetical protein
MQQVLFMPAHSDNSRTLRTDDARRHEAEALAGNAEDSAHLQQRDEPFHVHHVGGAADFTL